MTTIAKDVRLRPLQASDYGAISRIAATTSGFTVPTNYMVWMFVSTHGDLCRVALDEDGSIIGYRLGMMTNLVSVAKLGTIVSLTPIQSEWGSTRPKSN